MIYVMTCPCGQFEYIGQTSLKLNDRLYYHRQHFNRIIHEFLVGEENIKLIRLQPKDNETLRKDRMLLYKHAARCPSVIQRFLNCNPIYSCFIPIPFDKAIEHNQNYVLPSTLVLLDHLNPTAIASKNQIDALGTSNKRSDEVVRSFIRKLPPIPTGYTFSIPQRIKQFQYFKTKLDANMNQHPYLDLFNVAIIAVLPHDATDVVRQFVESLFITHTQTKLNTSGRLVQDDDDIINSNINIHPMTVETQLIDRGEWCRSVNVSLNMLS